MQIADGNTSFCEKYLIIILISKSTTVHQNIPWQGRVVKGRDGKGREGKGQVALKC